MMAYLKPPWFTVQDLQQGRHGHRDRRQRDADGDPRSGGEAQRIPVLTVVVDGIRYLVSTRGESQWVKQRPGHPDGDVGHPCGTTDYLAEEIPVDQRERVLAAYQAKAGKAVEGYFRSLPQARDHPVFALTPA